MITRGSDYKVMKLFFDNQEKKFHIRQIARLVRLSAPGVLKVVARLKKKGLLASERSGVVENVSAAKNERFLRLKACYNMLALHESGLLGFLREEYEEPEAIVAFGSYAKGEDSSTSDIDIAVMTGRRKSLDLKKFERALGRKISIYETTARECTKEFLNNLANGIVLHGYLRVVL